jgi:general stress protein YciG
MSDQAGTQRRSSENRGFAAMDQEKQREIARKGGQAAHDSGHAHEFTSEEARTAGRKGGEAVSADRQHMAEIGRKGGTARHQSGEP